MSGPLSGYRVIELAGVGPAPFAAMLFSDMGAEVIRVDRVVNGGLPDRWPGEAVIGRGRRSVAIDVKHPEGRHAFLALVEQADAVLEGFRPGVVERLGIGPDDCMGRNARLVYGRMTGWGREGPCAHAAAHDINYLAMSGILSMIGRAGERPLPPLNLVADFGGGGMLLAFGVVCAMLESRSSGVGQVVDAAMIDGSVLLAAMIHGFRAEGSWGPRGTNVLDSGAWFYDVYETADGGFITFGALEPQFFSEMVRLTGLADDIDGLGPVLDPNDPSTWPSMRRRLAALVRTRSRDEWSQLLEGTDACFAPVLDPEEAARHPQLKLRDVYVDFEGATHPAPAPRFSRTPGNIAGPASQPGQHTDAVLHDWGLHADTITRLRELGAVI